MRIYLTDTIKRGIDMDNYFILLLIYTALFVISYNVLKPYFNK